MFVKPAVVVGRLQASIGLQMRLAFVSEGYAQHAGNLQHVENIPDLFCPAPQVRPAQTLAAMSGLYVNASLSLIGLCALTGAGVAIGSGETLT